jgi:hypothetical protein
MEITKKSSPIPLIAGILAIVAGSLKLFALFGLIIFSFFVMAPPSIRGIVSLELIWVAFVPVLILIALSIGGGIFAIQRKLFGLALTGAIAALLPFSLFGLASIILLAISKDEFD